VGYSGGEKENPTYRNMGDHTECIQVMYDPDKVSYGELLNIMFKDHYGYNREPYSLQYRSGIWFQDDLQRKAAEDKIKSIEKETGRKVFTHVAPLGDFYLAEEYHQKYHEKAKSKLFSIF